MKIRFDRPENKQPDRDKGLRVAYAGSKRVIASWRWYLILLIVCSPLFFLLGKFASLLWSVQGSGYVVFPQVEIRAAESGYIREIGVETTQEVRPGAFLCLLDQPDLNQREQLIAAELDYLTNLQSAPPPPNASQSEIGYAREQVVYMKKRLADFADLFHRGAATDAEVKTARYQYEQALGHLAGLERGAAMAKAAGLSSADARNADRIRQLTLEKNELRLRREQLRLVSPVAGRVSEIQPAAGQYVTKGDLILTLITNEQASINVYLKPEFIKYAEIGRQAVIVFPDGEKAAAKIVNVPDLTKLLPSDATTAFSENKREIFIKMAFTQAVRQKLMHGLPVEVIF